MGEQACKPRSYTRLFISLKLTRSPDHLTFMYTMKKVEACSEIVDCPTQLIHIGISICQHTSTKDIAGQSASGTWSM